jgi:hypothetical protein
MSNATSSVRYRRKNAKDKKQKYSFHDLDAYYLR